MPGQSHRMAFLGSNSPWNTTRSSAHQHGSNHREGVEGLQRSQGEDHTVTNRHRLSLHRYPDDCPPLKVRWFYAVDSPKWKPSVSKKKIDESRPMPPPKKFVPFSYGDSQSIENAFQSISEVEANREKNQSHRHIGKTQAKSTKVPVNEDFLFDVDVERRELSPAYWVGPIYEVRRGTWFFQEGSTVKPCEENLATQLEEGYLKIKPWRSENTENFQSQHSSNLKTKDKNGAPRTDKKTNTGSSQKKEQYHLDKSVYDSGLTKSAPLNEPRNYRLFGAYMSSIATYQDSSTALLTSDDFMSRVSGTVYQKLGGVPGTRVLRGITEMKKPKQMPSARNSQGHFDQEFTPTPELSSTELRGAHISEIPDSNVLDGEGNNDSSNADKHPRSTLERQMSSLAGEPQNPAELEEQARKQEEQDMEDLREVDDEDRERDIDHLVLVTHGIGQRLGLRLESINFIHDVNMLRKTMKSVYKASPDLQAFNDACADKNQNCRVQVLPVYAFSSEPSNDEAYMENHYRCWRHLLDFPYHGVRQNRRELDLTEADSLEDDIYPNLADITLDSVPAVRNLISDLAMDVLLYQSAYCDHISSIVKNECNRILKLFKERNPSFRGSVSLCGHSLGSAILFDILCHEKSGSDIPLQEDSGGVRNDRSEPSMERTLEFDCEELFCLGSPIALFQMLRGKTISGRSSEGSDKKRPIHIGGETESMSFTSSAGLRGRSFASHTTDDAKTIVSSPRCGQLYNIFHPSDPVSYRIEPLISSEMSSLRPQPLPSVKKNIWTASGQSLSIIGNRVGQSVGSLWTNFTSGVASSLLNRSLGLNTEETPHQVSSQSGLQPQQPQSPSPADLDYLHCNSGERRPTLIEADLETLCDGFQKAARGPKKPETHHTGNNEQIETYLRKIKSEEAKVRSLNSNGRVDYSIQEGAFDISLIASIASHLTYWTDEDVNHFMLSQMLSRQNRQQKRPWSSG